jgi:DNA-directed RNA polymerase subunit RPC12/RpoP
MDIMLISMLPLLVPLAFLLYLALRSVKCPDCGDTLPIFYSPSQKTRRMWRAGGYLCARCGCETNMAGEKVTADTPPAPFPTLQWALLAAGLLVGVGLWASLIVGGLAVAARPAPVVIAAPAVVPTPPLVEPAQPAPAVAPVN